MTPIGLDMPATSSSATNVAKFTYREIVEIAPNYWNVQQPLVMMGCLDIRTHMNLIKLETGKFVVLDTVRLSPTLKAELDHLTVNGTLIEAVVATHPFHTLYFPAFYAYCPHAAYYGTPRHLRRQTQIPWAGDVCSTEFHQKWSPEIEMSLPAGAEFANPPEGNHFAGLFVYHQLSRTLHVDDTVMFVEKSTCLLRCMGAHTGSMSFHLSFTGDGLNPTPQAPIEFKNWLQTQVIDRWDFDNIVTAHMGNMIGGAKAKLQLTLNAAEPDIQRLVRKHTR
jgi:hypothetical protein